MQSNELIDRMLYIDIKNHLQSLLHLEDRTSMAASLESRLPLLDYRLVEYALGQPASARFARGRRHLLKEAVRGIVPDEIIDRKDKMGFPVPIFEWFGGELKEYVEDILLGERTRERGFFDMGIVEGACAEKSPLVERSGACSRLNCGFVSFLMRAELSPLLREGTWLLAILGIVGLIYAGALTGSFHFDDTHSLLENPAVRDLANLPQLFFDTQAFSRNEGSQIPGLCAGQLHADLPSGRLRTDGIPVGQLVDPSGRSRLGLSFAPANRAFLGTIRAGGAAVWRASDCCRTCSLRECQIGVVGRTWRRFVADFFYACGQGIRILIASVFCLCSDGEGERGRPSGRIDTLRTERARSALGGYALASLGWFGLVLAGYLCFYAVAAARGTTRSSSAFAGRAARRAKQGRLVITQSSCWACSPKVLSINSMWPTKSAALLPSAQSVLFLSYCWEGAGCGATIARYSFMPDGHFSPCFQR